MIALFIIFVLMTFLGGMVLWGAISHYQIQKELSQRSEEPQDKYNNQNEDGNLS